MCCCHAVSQLDDIQCWLEPTYRPTRDELSRSIIYPNIYQSRIQRLHFPIRSEEPHVPHSPAKPPPQRQQHHCSLTKRHPRAYISSFPTIPRCITQQHLHMVLCRPPHHPHPRPQRPPHIPQPRIRRRQRRRQKGIIIRRITHAHHRTTRQPPESQLCTSQDCRSNKRRNVLPVTDSEAARYCS